MQVLHMLRVNVFKFVVLMGTLALAMAFAGNDLVNFIGVPLAGMDSFRDYVANSNGLDARDYMMTSWSRHRHLRSSCLQPALS